MKNLLKEIVRNPLWRKFEKEIQERAKYKDETFRLNGKWKRFYRSQQNFQIYLVNGEWVRNNLSIIFGNGGHGLVHEFIPLDEIWVDILTKFDFELVIKHEIVEFWAMTNDLPYWRAHLRALKAEKER